MFKASKARTREGQRPPRVVILGGGYGGVYTALGLQRMARRGQIELTLVSRNNFLLFQPLLAEVVAGSVEPAHILNPIRRLCPFTKFDQAEIKAIDVGSSNVIIHYPDHTDYRSIPYDHLVICVGSGTDLSTTPGVSEHAFPFKTMGDALWLRDHLIGVLERAEVEADPSQARELLTFVVVGGGYTGVEVAAEINDFVREASKSFHRVEAGDIRVILLQRGDRILPELGEGLANFSHQLMERHGIEVRLNTSIKSATERSTILSDGTAIPARTLVAALGAVPNQLLDSLPCPRDSRGRIEVDPTLAVPGYPGIWALGDCAAIPDLGSGGACPTTAQYAVREASQLARNIRATIKGDMPRPFSYRSLGVFVPLGRFSAAGELLGFKISGFLAWWLYRSFYLYQLPRLERKIKVFIGWSLNLFFRRDIVNMGVARSGGTAQAHYETGQIILGEGELARNFYIILEGQVQVSRQQGGQDTLVATLGPGEFFGEMSLLQGVRTTASVRALNSVDLLTMKGGDFTALATSSTGFGDLLGSVMRHRLSGSDITGASQASDCEVSES